MKNLFLAACLTVLPTLLQASIEMKSFYFKSMTSELQFSSQDELEELKELMDEFDIQFIEFNAFTEKNQFNKTPVQLAEKRIQFFIRSLALEDEEIALNAYGNERITLDFQPFNWERIDVYFNKSDKIPELLVESKKKDWENDPYYFPVAEELQETQPRVFNPVIHFPRGKTKIPTSTGDEELARLLDTLISRPELNANIRGHVCCQHNQRASKKRAKFVYKYLIENGVHEDRLTFEGMSFSAPLVYPERNSYERNLNRRVDVEFSTTETPEELADQ